MNALGDPFRQLMERKLWPIALVLVAALVAVPLLLSKPADKTASLPASTADIPDGQGTTDSIVSVGDAEKRDRVRAVLGDRKDPFRPAQLLRVKKDASQEAAAAATTVNAGSGADSGSSDTATGGTTPVATPTPTPAPTFELYSLKVRFGSAAGGLKTREVKRLTGLPGGANPAALYLGLRDDHKSAVFIIDAGVQVLGDGHCEPAPDDCQTLTLKKGETEFLTRGETQYELDLVDIHVKKTTDAKAAKASRTAVAADGRTKLKGLIGRIGALRYDAAAGALKKIPRTEQAKRVTKATSIAGLLAAG